MISFGELMQEIIGALEGLRLSVVCRSFCTVVASLLI